MRLPIAYRQYSWLASPYSAKTRAYFAFKGVPYEEVSPSAVQLYGKIKKAVGRVVMPTVQTPEGRWLQDTSDIIDEIERRHPTPSIIPTGATQRLASSLLELHGDEWWPIVMMHTRWNVPGNAEFAKSEFARAGFPWLPRFIGRRLASPIAKQMSSYRPVLGVRPETVGGIESYGHEFIRRLDAHLAAHEFILGGRPCLGDFAIFGPLWAHVFRDPATRDWFDDAPNVCAWFGRLQAPTPAPGDFLPNDEVPPSLDAIFRTLFEEQFAHVRDLVGAIDMYVASHPDATRVPRSLGEHPFTIGGAKGTRKLLTFTQWMAQRPIDAYRGFGTDERVRVDRWLRRVGGFDAMKLEIKHPFVRKNFKMALA